MLVRSRTIDEIGQADAESSGLYRAGRLDSVGIGEVLHPRDYAVDCEDVGAGYYAQVPMAGRFEARHRGRTLTTGRDATAVLTPEGGAFLGRWSVGTRALCVRFDREPVRAALTRLLGDQAPDHLVLDLEMDTSAGYGRSWVDLLISVNRQLRAVDGLLAQPLVAAPLADALLTGFLLATTHSCSAALAAPTAAVRPSVIRAAVDLIEADPRAPLTVSMLAEHCAVGTRTLQSGFRRHLGMTPMAYVRETRLRRAHDELRLADPRTETVAAVAQRWGFAHLGRFAAAHKARYGQTPLKTLHSAR